MSKQYYKRLLIGGEFDGVTEYVPLPKLTPTLVNKVTAPIYGQRLQHNVPYVIREPQHKPQADSTVIYEFSPGALCPEIEIPNMKYLSSRIPPRAAKGGRSLSEPFIPLNQ